MVVLESCPNAFYVERLHVTSCDVVAVPDKHLRSAAAEPTFPLFTRHSWTPSNPELRTQDRFAASSLLVELLQNELHYATKSGGLTWLALIGLTTYRY
jgi:hypothetical protein